MNSKQHALPRPRCVQDFLATLEAGTIEMQFWREYALTGVPAVNLGRFETTKSDLANIYGRWDELFMLPRPVNGVLYVWPGFAFIYVQQNRRDVTVNAVLIEKKKFRYFPMQAHFCRAKRQVRYEQWALGGDVGTFANDQDTIGWLPDMYLRAIDAQNRLILAEKPSKNWNWFREGFMDIVQPSPALAA